MRIIFWIVIGIFGVPVVYLLLTGPFLFTMCSGYMAILGYRDATHECLQVTDRFQ